MVQTPIEPQFLYPDSDGKPIADNTIQYRWIVRLVANLKHLFKGQTVSVAGDLLWYPQQVLVPPFGARFFACHRPEFSLDFANAGNSI